MAKKKTTQELVTITSTEQKGETSDATITILATRSTPEEMFDQTARAILEIRSEIATKKEAIVMLDEDLAMMEKEMTAMLNSKVQGREMSAEWIVKMRRIGAPSMEDLAFLEQMNEGLVKRIPGEVLVRDTREEKIGEARDILTKAGIPHKVTPPSIKAAAVGEVDKVIKENRDFWSADQHRQIWERLDIKESRELKVFPTILGTAEEQ